MIDNILAMFQENLLTRSSQKIITSFLGIVWYGTVGGRKEEWLHASGFTLLDGSKEADGSKVNKERICELWKGIESIEHPLA